MGRSKLVYYYRDEIKNKRYVIEQSIFRVIDDSRYPEAIKYSLIFVEVKTGKKVLIDNHYPKGHHLHLDELEMSYEYKNEESLIEDFKDYVFKHFGEKI